MTRSLLLSSVALSLALAACTGTTGSSLPSRCEAIDVDPTRELIVTDPAIVGDSRADFARVMGAVLGPQSNAAARSWMDAWSATRGEESIASDVTAPWAASSADGLDLSRAPFELIAIVNRVDLTSQGRPGEIRFVYGLVTSGVREPLTVNVELQLPDSGAPAEWATAWHGLGVLTGNANREATMAIVDAVLRQPIHGQVRTQDGRVATPILHEFDIQPGAPLVPSPLFNQPAAEVSPSDLAAFVAANADAVMADEEVVPSGMLASAARTVPPTFDLPNVSSDVVTAFSVTTCTGCHTSEPTLDGTFHISPLRRGQDALSSFLVGSGSQAAELSRRAEVLRGLLCN